MKYLKKLLPNASTNHMVRQGMYTNLIKYGTTEQAKNTFQRPPFYMTASEVRTRKDNINE